MRISIVAIIFLVLTSCGVAVRYDYNETAKFNTYKNYAYYTDMETGFTELEERRLFRAIDANLEQKGFIKSDNPDFIIDISGSVYKSESHSSVGFGVGGTNGASSGGVGVNMPVNANKMYNDLVIEFIDKQTEQAFWMANTNVTVSTSDSTKTRDAYFVSVVDKILSKYPPKSN